ncbi:hypothetical protein QYM36_011182 [Artemia franciscana]|uniref:Uncharacterized protein n=1 Tax=Artemia franciscana TaxID=6661 RepID=A0AA88L8S8_ARTSF|nr:hypothetical protein QYM36_011182 [Artemia franciscana]
MHIFAHGFDPEESLAMRKSLHHPFIRNSLLEPKKCMKKELCERGNGVGSEDVGTNSNSSDEGGSNQIPVLSKALAGTSLLSSTFESSVPTSLVCSSSLPIPYLTKVAQQPKLTSLPLDSGDGMVEDDLPHIAFEDEPDEEEEQQL